MAIINVQLLGSGETVINDQNANDGDVIHLEVVDSGTLVVDGVKVSIGNIIGAGAASSSTFAAQNGGELTIDQGLLTANLLSNPTFEIRDDGIVKLDASAISLGLTETLLNKFDVEYTGDNHTGKFVYDPPVLSALGVWPQTFNVNGMAATDEFTIDGRENLRLDAPLKGLPPSRDPQDAYRDGELHLVSPAAPLLGERVNVKVPMTQEEFDMFMADQSAYLGGGTFTFPGELAAPCFASGTMILTASGEASVDSLRAGDMIMTRDHGPQPIRWIGSRSLSAATLAALPNLRPIRIRAGALGKNIPATDLLVSPQHRVLVRSKIARRMFDADEVLVAAKQLLFIDGVEIAQDLENVEYFHILFDRHQVVFSNGAETESLYTGPEALKSLGAAARAEIFALFPEFAARDHVPVAARSLAPGKLARKLAQRHVANQQILVQH